MAMSTAATVSRGSAPGCLAPPGTSPLAPDDQQSQHHHERPHDAVGEHLAAPDRPQMWNTSGNMPHSEYAARPASVPARRSVS